MLTSTTRQLSGGRSPAHISSGTSRTSLGMHPSVASTSEAVTAAPGGPATDVAQALERAREHLLGLQHDEGWWKGELETNVTMDAEDLLLRQFLGIRGAETTERSARWIRSQQRSDGSWSNFWGGPGDLSTTIEAYVALRLAGDGTQEQHMQAASTFVRGQGGLEKARVFTHIWLALFGAWPWDRVPVLPPEVMFLPSWVPLNVYDFACWARQTVVALTVVLSHRPIRALPFGVDELRGSEPWTPTPARSPAGRALVAIDRFLHAYERRPVRRLRELALRRAERWIVDRQEADGCWGGIQPPWVYSIMALHLLGYELDHPVLRNALDGLEGFTIREGSERRLEACQSPVWDTALAVVALSDAGLRGSHPALVKAADWLLGEEVVARGDWAVRRPELAPGGWAFEFENVNYPDVDDTAEVVLALLRVDHPEPVRLRAAVERGTAWIEGMQSSDGGWAAFDADNCQELIRDHPFCDFGEVIDPPSADVTAHVLEMLAALGRAPEQRGRRGLEWLLRAQEPDGSWFGRWGVNHVYGTGAAVPALVAAGVDRSSPSVRRAVRWLERHQNEDGGWGEDPRSYDEADWIGRGESTASQTAWALLALHSAGEHTPAVERGLRWLVDTQRPDGTWDEPQFTGTGFPSDFYINYHLYRLVFPIMALGRFAG
jgi:squalene-hopene/tetraprenyl-beta-curcumene cyclase